MSDATSRPKKKKVPSPEALERKRARNREYMRRRSARFKAAGIPTTSPEVRKRQQEAARKKYKEDEAYREKVKERSRKESKERYYRDKTPWKVMGEKRKQRMLSDPAYAKKLRDQHRTRAAKRYAGSEDVRKRHAAAWQRWYAKNKDKRREYSRKYKTKRLKDDVAFWLKHAIRSRLNIALRRQYASGSAIDDLGCSIDEFVRHIESQFVPGMSWENRGNKGWHIDHIIPLAAFDLKDPQQRRQACHYTNMQPLWAKENMSKKARILPS